MRGFVAGLVQTASIIKHNPIGSERDSGMDVDECFDKLSEFGGE